MRLEVFRSTAICWFGNEHLFAADENHLVEVALKSCFRNVERFEFVRPSAHHLAAPGASFVLGTKTWYRRLKADGVEALRLHLPLSSLEPLPTAYGVVSDSPSGCDIWVQTPASSIRNVEFAAQRFAAWSLPKLKPSSDLAGELVEAVFKLNAEHSSVDTSLARQIARLATSFKEPGWLAEGFEDGIPTEFSSHWRLLAARALRTVALLGADDLNLAAHAAFLERVDASWQLGLRLLEAITAEVAAERSRAAAA